MSRFRSTSSRLFSRTWVAAAAAVALVAASHGAHADDAPATATSVADTSAPVMFLKETIVTGSRYPRAYYESPQALSFILKNRIREQDPTVVGDLLQELPGVDNSKDSPWEQRPVLRGLSGQRVLVMMDGSPMNSARGNGPHPSLVDPAQVERIEVVRGPSSVAYGSDALGGVINIITRQGAASGPTMSGSATIGGSTADQQRTGYLELMPRIGKLATFLSSGGRRSLDFEAPSGKVPNSGFSDYNALFNLRYDFTGNTALKGGYQLYRGDHIGIPGLSFATPTAQQAFQFAFYDRDYANLTLEHRYGGSWLETTRVKTYWQRERRNFFSDQNVAAASFSDPQFSIPARAGAENAITTQDRLFDLDTYGLQLQMISAKTSLYRFTGGVDAVRDMTDGDNVRFRTYYDANGDPVPGPGGTPATAKRITASVPDGRFDNYVGYMQSEWFVRDRVTLSAGGRFTHHRYRTDFGLSSPAAGPSPAVYFQPKKVDDDALSGSLGVVFEPIQDLHLSANVANGYREPNAQDLFFNGAASVGFVIGNPDLKPEKSVSYDVGLRYGPRDLAFSGNLYYSTYEDLIDALPVAPGTYQYVNVSEARIYGGEAQAEWRYSSQWTTRAAIAGSIGDITSREAIEKLYGVSQDKAPLGGVPPLKGTLSVRWQDRGGRLWVEPSMRYSWRTNRLPLPTPGVPQIGDYKKEWLVGDLFAGYSLPTRQRVVLGVRNIGDRTYRLPLGSLDEPGISFVGSLSTDF